MTREFNREDQVDLRRRLREEMTVPERLLWSRLRGRQLAGLKFRRQHGVGPYVMDFYCPAAKLAIEVDGPTHFEGHEAEARDAVRDAYLRRQGVRTVRFTNTEVAGDLARVVERILAALDQAGPPPDAGRPRPHTAT